MKLSAKQIELLLYLQKNPDVTVRFSRYMGSLNQHDYYNCWGFGRCTQAAAALYKRGLLKKVSHKSISIEHELVLSDEGRAWKRKKRST